MRNSLLKVIPVFLLCWIIIGSIGCKTSKKNNYKIKVINAKKLGCSEVDSYISLSKLIHAINQGPDEIEIYFPEGKYYFSNLKEEQLIEIKNKTEVIISGEGLYNSIIVGDRKSNSNCTSIFTFRNCRKIVIKDIAFEAKNSTKVSEQSSIDKNKDVDYNMHKALYIHGRNTEKLHLQDVSFQYFSGVALHSIVTGVDVLVENCIFKNLLREIGKNKIVASYKLQPTGLLVVNGSKVKVYNSVFKDIIDTTPNGHLSHSIYVSNISDSIIIDNNTFLNNEKFPFTTNGSGGFQVNGGYSKGLKLVNNKFNNVTSNINDGHDYVIEYNVFINSRLALNNVKNSFISKNKFQTTIYLPEQIGVVLSKNNNSNLTFEGNDFISSAPYSYQSCAFQAYGSNQNLRLFNNKFINFASSIVLGINSRTVDITSVTIDGNIFEVKSDFGSYGVNIKSGNRIMVTNNRIINNNNRNFKFINNHSKVSKEDSKISLLNNKFIGLSEKSSIK